MNIAATSPQRSPLIRAGFLAVNYIFPDIDPPARLPLPSGKLTIRFRQMRGTWQCFAGSSTYITGASGESIDDAIHQLAYQYKIPRGSIATVHGLEHPFEISIP